jgi:putative ABC transport system permease protein
LGWRVELSRSAVAALRALSRADQEQVARRIGALEEVGLPPASVDASNDPRTVSVGEVRLQCVEHTEEGRIVVVSLHAVGEALGHRVARHVRRGVARWFPKGEGGGEMRTLAQDLRYALRALRKAPAFSAMAVLTLALGIGAAAAIYSVASGVLLRPLPYGDPDRVVTVWSSWVNFPDKTWVSLGEYQAYVQDGRSFDDLALYYTTSANFTDPESPERVGAAGVTPNIFSVLGVQPALGRVFTWDEARAESNLVLLGYDVWQRRFNGDRGLVGRTVQLDGVDQTVVGILPRGFVLPVDYASPTRTSVYYPQYVDREAPDPVRTNGGNHGWYSVGRLKPGVTVAKARSDLVQLADRWVADGIRDASMKFVPRVYAAKDDIVGTARPTIMVLLGAVVFVLLIACGNVANLLLARSEVRVREVAVRTALGAGRGRVLRQLLTEALVLAVVAGTLGLAMAFAGVRALLAVDPTAVPRADGIHVDTGVALFTLGLSVLTTLFFGVAPALRVSRGKLGSNLGEGARGAGASARSNRAQGLLVAAQMAMTVLLLTGSGLTIRTFTRLLAVDPGFHPRNVLTLRVTAPSASYPDDAAVVRFYDDLLRRVHALPGVTAAGAARLLPMASQMGDAGVNVESYARAPDESTQGEWQWVTPGYLEVMGIPLLEGRTFDQRDNADGDEAIIINKSLARHYFGDDSPLGSRIRVFGEWATVVGVVGDVRHNAVTAPPKERFYRPQAQITNVTGTIRSMTLTIQAAGDPTTLIQPVRRTIAEMDPRMPVSEVQTMDQVMSEAVAQPRFAMTLLGAFSVLALALAVMGIYGVLAYAVSRRTQEIGIRMALGAEGRQVVGMVVRQGMTMALLGIAVGTGFALGLTRFMQGILYGVTPQDPVTFVAVPLLFAAVAVLACWIPAARAAGVHPSEALRYE